MNLDHIYITSFLWATLRHTTLKGNFALPICQRIFYKGCNFQCKQDSRQKNLWKNERSNDRSPRVSLRQTWDELLAASCSKGNQSFCESVSRVERSIPIPYTCNSCYCALISLRYLTELSFSISDSRPLYLNSANVWWRFLAHESQFAERCWFFYSFRCIRYVLGDDGSWAHLVVHEVDVNVFITDHHSPPRSTLWA